MLWPERLGWRRGWSSPEKQTGGDIPPKWPIQSFGKCGVESCSIFLKCDDQWNFGFNSMVDVLWNLSSLMKRGALKQV